MKITEEKLIMEKILNSSNQDILNMAEIPSIVFEMMIEIIKLVILFTIFLVRVS